MANISSWLIFLAITGLLIIFDLGILNRRPLEITVKKSLCLTGFYILIAVLFGLWIYYTQDLQKASQYYTGYLVELSLSLDNLFIMSMIFSYFAIPRQYQHNVLFWGILGVIIFRAIMIGLGTILIAKFSWMLYLFGVFLILMGIKMLFIKNNNKNFQQQKQQINNNFILKFMQKYFRITPELCGDRFWIKQGNPKKYWFTPLFMALILIETADILFAFDSIPAIFVITTDPYIVYTSNIFALLGLRSLYFALDALLARFIYLPYALSLVLIFIGSKVFAAHLWEGGKFPPAFSLSITFLLLAGGIGLSLWKTHYGHSTHNRR